MANRVLLGNVKGETGATGATGATGQAGANGLTPYIQNGTWWLGTQDTGISAEGNKWIVNNVAPTIEGNNGDLYLDTSTYNIYKKENNIWELKGNIKGNAGERGEKGEKGDTALTLNIGSVTTGDVASVENVGSQTDLILNFVIPKGEKGEKGEQGIQGIQGPQGEQGIQGEKGDAGTKIIVASAEVESLEFNANPQTQIDEINARLDAKATEPFVFDTYVDFINWLNGSFNREDERTILDLQIGSDIFIKQEGYPDYWCSSLQTPFTSANFTAYETKQNYVRFDVEQVLSEEQKEIAQQNIGIKKTTTITETSTDTEVPSAKAVYDLVGNVEALLTDLNSGTGV